MGGRTRRQPKPPPPPATLDGYVDPVVLARLAASHRETWQAFVPLLARAESLPPDLVAAMLAIDHRDGWHRRSFTAFSGLNPDDGMAAWYELNRWLRAA